jgi:hypothetical protein
VARAGRLYAEVEHLEKWARTSSESEPTCIAPFGRSVVLEEQLALPAHHGLPLMSSFDLMPSSTSTNAVGVWTRQWPFARAARTDISGVFESQCQILLSLPAVAEVWARS